MQNIITEVGMIEDDITGDRSKMLGKYSKTDRTAASLLTAGIKAQIISEIRELALERMATEPLENPLDSLEGNMAQAAYAR